MYTCPTGQVQPGLQESEHMAGKLNFRLEHVSTHEDPHGLNIAPCTLQDPGLKKICKL